MATAARPSQFKAVHCRFLPSSFPEPYSSPPWLQAALHGEALFTSGVPVLLARVLLFMESLQVVFATLEEG